MTPNIGIKSNVSAEGIEELAVNMLKAERAVGQVSRRCRVMDAKSIDRFLKLQDDLRAARFALEPSLKKRGAPSDLSELAMIQRGLIEGSI